MSECKECGRLRSNWLAEQKQRLDQFEFMEMYSADKAKVKIDRLTAINAELLAACEDVKKIIGGFDAGLELGEAKAILKRFKAATANAQPHIREAIQYLLKLKDSESRRCHRLARLIDRLRNTLSFVRMSFAVKYNAEQIAAIDDQLAEVNELLRGKPERENRPFHPVEAAIDTAKAELTS